MGIHGSQQRPGVWLSAICGLVAALTAISMATLAASTSRVMRSPLVDIGDRFIEITPAWLKDLAISWFGTNDKIALLAGIAVILLLFSAGIGMLSMRSRLVYGMAGIALFGAVGTLAALAGGRGVVAAVPSLVGATTGILLLWWLHRLWYRGEAGQDEFGQVSRRRLLLALGGAALGLGAIGLGGVALGRRLEVPVDGPLPPLGAPLPPLPTGVSFDVPGLSPFVTSNTDFYRIDTALTIPAIPPEEYLLRIHGLADRELVLSYRDLVARRQVEADITMTCVSNEVGGSLVGNARWQGVRLADLLAEAGIDPTADQIVGRSYDGYTCGFPVAALDDGRDALVAIGMNGEPLPIEHGYPARLIVPGLYGYVSATKWLREIELTTFAEFDHYWKRRGWAEQAPIKTQSRIDTPGPLEKVPVGRSVIAGVAWAQTRGISRVEVKVDDGPWVEAELADQLSDTTWRQWRTAWDVMPGNHSIAVRATDGNGDTQTEDRAAPMPDGSSGWHSIVAIGVDQ
jgi:DMSO/TMAO reductase YedYZ molybdopterin-dependent catalytic subunit